MRTVSGTARDETTWTQPISGIFFNNSLHGQTGQSSSVNGSLSATALNDLSAHNPSQEAASSVEKTPSNDSFGGHETDTVFRKMGLGHYF
ncbi:hypothetical protein D9619_010485 [Psilocybe cf. subviscida]|uniref:Uncharacterized protein n=1 Tax=Psilocybe cf. subviscida TaxID=2480587 RepID=A0A8H5ASF5_9AGAR|nr:hypothetical protein D9619_010485 [Psilocybe cf. subviscida]